LTSEDSVLIFDAANPFQNQLLHLALYSKSKIEFALVGSSTVESFGSEPSVIVLNQNQCYELYHSLTDKIQKTTQGSLLGAVYEHVRKKKMFNMSCGYLHSVFLEGLVFNKIKESTLGNNIRIIFLTEIVAPPVVETFRIIFNCQVITLHSLNESVGVSLCSMFGDYLTRSNFAKTKFGFIGRPLSHLEIKLVQSDKFPFIKLDDGNPRGEVVIL
jgi:long-subunit acyl-CoA synthetase (AMP-forming)